MSTDRDSLREIIGMIEKSVSKDYIGSGPIVKHKVTRRLIHTSGNVRGGAPSSVDRKMIDRLPTNELSEGGISSSPTNSNVVNHIIISNKLLKHDSSATMHDQTQKESVHLKSNLMRKVGESQSKAVLSSA